MSHHKILSKKPKREKNNFFCHCDPDNKQPVISPLKTLEDVYNWEAEYDEFCRATATSDSNILKNSSRTILCHDMMGGYHDDRFVQGVVKDSFTCYCFYNWQYVDIFIYFSHCFITIPPPCWTNAAHRHGTKMLGTMIVEWTGGAEICKQILKSEESCKIFAQKLLKIAEYYRFDGWLINIESEIEVDHIDHLIYFLQILTTTIHVAVPNSQIIWYDSVIHDGSLLWQDCLNEKNEFFFSVTDGIFLNYNWNTEKLEKSYSLAGTRHWDVYVGVDIWGRSGKCQEGFDCHLAVKECREQQLSVALFATAWTYEFQGKDDFSMAENQFWYLLSKNSTIHCPTKLPFATSFCEGHGSKLFQYGKIISSNPWLNLTCQQIQPTTRRYHYRDYCILKRENYWEMSAKVSSSTKTACFRLYHCRIDEQKPFKITWTYKLLRGSAIHLELLFKTFKGNITVSSETSTEDCEIKSSEETSDDWTTRMLFVTTTYLSLERICVVVHQSADSHVKLLMKDIKVARISDEFHHDLQVLCLIIPEEDYLSITSCQEIAYNGGNSLKLRGCFGNYDSIVIFRLFKCELKLIEPVLVTYTYKTASPICVTLGLTTGSNEILLLNEEIKDEKIQPLQKENITPFAKYGVNIHRDLESGWITKAFMVNVDTTITEISLNCRQLFAHEQLKFYLGEIRILPLTELPEAISGCDFCQLSLNFLDPQYIVINCILHWTASQVQWFNVFYSSGGDNTFLGFTHNTMYKVSNLKVDKALSFLTFYIEPITSSGIICSRSAIVIPLT